jgi:peptidylprolyl isomerase
MQRALLAVVVAAISTAATAQAPDAPAPPPAVPGSEWKPLDPANTLVIESTKGRIVVEMRPDLAPAHVARIKALARQGYYDGSLFYRVLPFMAQTGDKGDKQFRSALPNLKSEAMFQLRPATPYGSFAASPIGDLGFVGAMPVLIEPDPARPADQAPTTGRGSGLFCPGTVGFAHGESLDSANSQIFLMRLKGPHLEKKFTAWGRVVDGQAAVAALNNGEPPSAPDKMTRVRVMSDLPAAARPKLTVMDTKSPAFAQLLQAEFKAKGAAFNLCDVPIPTQPG